MSTPASRWVDARMTEALDRLFPKFDAYVKDGYCTHDDVLLALSNGWGEGVAEGWLEYVDEEQP